MLRQSSSLHLQPSASQQRSSQIAVEHASKLKIKMFRSCCRGQDCKSADQTVPNTRHIRKANNFFPPQPNSPTGTATLFPCSWLKLFLEQSKHKLHGRYWIFIPMKEKKRSQIISCVGNHAVWDSMKRTLNFYWIQRKYIYRQVFSFSYHTEKWNM